MGSQRGVQPLTLGNLYRKLTKSSKAIISRWASVKTPKSLPHVYASGHVDLYMSLLLWHDYVLVERFQWPLSSLFQGGGGGGGGMALACVGGRDESRRGGGGSLKVVS